MCAPWQGLLGSVWRRGLGCIVHVQCTCKCFERIIFSRPWGSHGWRHRSQTRRSHAYRTNLKSFGGTIAVECKLHAPGPENLFDEGSFGLTRAPLGYIFNAPHWGGGLFRAPPLISEISGPILKIQAAFESPGKTVEGEQILLTSGSRVTSQVRSKSKCSTFRAWWHRRAKLRC